MTSRGKRVSASLRSADEDARRFSSLVVLATIFFNQQMTLEKLKERLKKVFERLQEINEKIYFYFGSDHDPHRPRNRNLEGLLKNFIDTGYITLHRYKKETWLILTKKAVDDLIANLGFLTKYLLLNKKRNIKCLDGVSECRPTGGPECGGCGG